MQQRENSDHQMSNSEDIPTTSEEDPDNGSNQNPHKIFLLGYVPHAKHNSILKTIINDLLSHYYISWNASKWTDAKGEPSRTRNLMAKADALIFFINEQTLRDVNCLLALQYAWNLKLPILMLRPPMTKLVISDREMHHAREKILRIGECAIVRRSSGEPWQLLDDKNCETVDYRLLQCILYEGYRFSTVYDVRSHQESIKRLSRKLSSIFSNSKCWQQLSKSGSQSSSQPHFYLSPSNNSLYDARKLSRSRGSVIKSPHTTNMNMRRQSQSPSNDRNTRLKISMSTGNLFRDVVRTPYPRTKQFQFKGNESDEENDTDYEEADMISTKARCGRRRHVMKSPPPPDRIPSSFGASEVDEADSIKDKKPSQKHSTSMFKTPTLDLPVEDDSEIDADAFPPPPITLSSGLFSTSSGRNTEDSQSRFARSQFGSVTSRTSSLDRSSYLDDMSNYQRTQYLVFPLSDSGKKPYLLKFPEGMQEEENHGGSVWGSDTSLEEEVKLAGRINAGIVVDYVDDSPIVSPAPYLGDLI